MTVIERVTYFVVMALTVVGLCYLYFDNTAAMTAHHQTALKKCYYKRANEATSRWRALQMKQMQRMKRQREPAY